MDFDWMTPNRPAIDDAKRVAMYHREVRQRAAIFYRLGYSQAQATARLRANADWDFELDGRHRPAQLGDEAIGDLVATTYARRPAH